MTELPQLPPLRNYQTEGCARVRAEARRLTRARGGGGYGVLVVMPTGSGKTRCGLDFASGAIAKGGKTLWLAPRAELVDQPVARLAELGWYSTRVVKAGRVEGDPTAPITVASIQTLVARGYTPPADVVVFDEARHYVAARWAEIASAYPDAAKVGLDASPARADGSPLGDLFDSIVQISSVAELTAQGWLVPSVVYAPGQHQPELQGTPLEKWRQHADGLRTIVFCTSVHEAHRQAEEFRGAGVAAEAVDGTTPLEERRAALDRLRTGETLVICNCLLFTEGLDVVELEAIIIARGVANPWTWIQMGGRVLRPSPHTGKTIARIIDLRGHFHRSQFGPLNRPREWSLEGRPLRPLEPLPPCVQCRKCLAWTEGGRACPACGAEVPPPPPPRVKAGDLQEYRSQHDGEAERVNRLRGFVARELDAGRSAWRAAHIYRGTYGEAPSREQMRSVIREAEMARAST